MKRTHRRFVSSFLALVTGLSLMSCSPKTDTASSKSREEPQKICFINTGGINDGYFNEACYEGVMEFLHDHKNYSVNDIEEPDSDKIISALEENVNDYDIFVLPGFYFSEIGSITLANPQKKFIVIDTTVNDSDGNALELENVYTMTFKEEQAGFLAGVAAALSSKTGKVAVITGELCPATMNYQMGFMSGVNYSNARFDTKTEYVELPEYAAGTTLSTDNGEWNVGGNYIGSFTDQDKGEIIANDLIHEGCDILFIAAAAAGDGCFYAIKAAEGVYAIGCDVDQYTYGANGASNIILTSVLKGMDTYIRKALVSIDEGLFFGRNAHLNTVGYVSQTGHHQLTRDTMERLDIIYATMMSGAITPASCNNGYIPTDFPGL